MKPICKRFHKAIWKKVPQVEESTTSWRTDEERANEKGELSKQAIKKSLKKNYTGNKINNENWATLNKNALWKGIMI